MAMDHDYCDRDTNIIMQAEEHDLPHVVREVNEPINSGLTLKGNPVDQQMLKNALTFFRTKFPDMNCVEVTTQFLGVSTSTIRKFSEGPTAGSSQPITRKRCASVTKDLLQNNLKEIRLDIYDMYKEGTPVSISSLKRRLAEKLKYMGSRSSLFSVVKQLGFVYKEDDNRRYLMELPHVVYLRTNFLYSYMDNESHGEAKKPYVFLDETWVFGNGSVRRSWQDDDIKSVKRHKGDGQR